MYTWKSSTRTIAISTSSVYPWIPTRHEGKMARKNQLREKAQYTRRMHYTSGLYVHIDIYQSNPLSTSLMTVMVSADVCGWVALTLHVLDHLIITEMATRNSVAPVKWDYSTKYAIQGFLWKHLRHLTMNHFVGVGSKGYLEHCNLPRVACIPIQI